MEYARKWEIKGAEEGDGHRLRSGSGREPFWQFNLRMKEARVRNLYQFGNWYSVVICSSLIMATG